MADNTIFDTHISPMVPIPSGVVSAGALTGNIDCVLFDVYGTLLISGSGDLDHGDAAIHFPEKKIEQLLEKFHVARMSPEQAAEAFRNAVDSEHRKMTMHGIDHPEVAVECIWKDVLGFPDISVARNFAAEYELIVNPVYPMPGLRETLRELWRRKLFLGIISNAQFYTPLLLMYFLENSLQNTGFASELIFFSYQEKIAKPSPVMFRHAAEKLRLLHVPEDRVLYVGNDMKNDIVPAKQTGFATALFAGDRRSLRFRTDDPMVAGIFPDITITALPELVEILFPEP